MTHVTLTITGMHCGSCALAIEMVLKDKPGVTNAKVDFDSKKAEVDFDEQKVKTEELTEEIAKVGYKAEKV
jgi:copper chaperone CopZ